MRKLKSAIYYLTERSKLNAIISAVTLIAFLAAIVILGVVNSVCTMIECICKNWRKK